jgi:hypothetical protein
MKRIESFGCSFTKERRLNKAVFLNLIKNLSKTLLSFDNIRLFCAAREFADKGKQRQIHRDDD